MAAFWVVATSIVAKVYRRFRGALCLRRRPDVHAVTQNTVIFVLRNILFVLPTDVHVAYSTFTGQGHNMHRDCTKQLNSHFNMSEQEHLFISSVC
jgi:hypothetical protein